MVVMHYFPLRTSTSLQIILSTTICNIIKMDIHVPQDSPVDSQLMSGEAKPQKKASIIHLLVIITGDLGSLIWRNCNWSCKIDCSAIMISNTFEFLNGAVSQRCDQWCKIVKMVIICYTTMFQGFLSHSFGFMKPTVNYWWHYNESHWKYLRFNTL